MQGAKGGCISHRDEWLSKKGASSAPLRRKKNERCGEAPGVKPERAWATKNRAEGETQISGHLKARRRDNRWGETEADSRMLQRRASGVPSGQGPGPGPTAYPYPWPPGSCPSVSGKSEAGAALLWALGSG